MQGHKSILWLMTIPALAIAPNGGMQENQGFGNTVLTHSLECSLLKELVGVNS